MKKNNFIIILFLLTIIPFASANSYNYHSYSDSTDYFLVNTESVNTTIMSSDKLFGSYTFFTPRLNFTVPITDVLTLGGNVGSCIDTGWSSWTNISSSLVLKNGTNVIPASNYTFKWLNQATGQWCINFTDARYNSTWNLTVLFNRTFVKNVDDLVVCPSCIRSGPGGFLIFNTPTAYGDDSTFKFNTGYGTFINVSNWAVGWVYTERTLTSFPINGLGELGTDFSDFLTGITHGVVQLIFILGVLGGIILVIMAIASVIRSKLK